MIKTYTNQCVAIKYRRWFYLLWILEICTPWRYNKGIFLFDQQMISIFLFPDFNRIIYWTKFSLNIVAFVVLLNH